MEKLIMILKGSRSSSVSNFRSRNPFFGCLSTKTKEDCKKMIEILLTKNFLKYEIQNGKYRVIIIGDKNCNQDKIVTNRSIKVDSILDKLRKLRATIAKEKKGKSVYGVFR